MKINAIVPQRSCFYVINLMCLLNKYIFPITVLTDNLLYFEFSSAINFKVLSEKTQIAYFFVTKLF